MSKDKIKLNVLKVLRLILKAVNIALANTPKNVNNIRTGKDVNSFEDLVLKFVLVLTLWIPVFFANAYQWVKTKINKLESKEKGGD